MRVFDSSTAWSAAHSFTIRYAGHSGLYSLNCYFAEKLDLLLTIRDHDHVQWSGKHRSPLTGQGVYPRPVQNPLPIWLGVGGTPASFARAGTLGLPLMVAIIGGGKPGLLPLARNYRGAGGGAGPFPRQTQGGGAPPRR